MSWKLGKVDSPVCHVVPELVSLVVDSGHFEKKIRGAAPAEWSMGRLVGTCHEAASLFLVAAYSCVWAASRASDFVAVKQGHARVRCCCALLRACGRR